MKRKLSTRATERAITRNTVAGAVALAHNSTTMATVVVAMEAEFETPRDAENYAR